MELTLFLVSCFSFVKVLYFIKNKSLIFTSHIVDLIEKMFILGGSGGRVDIENVTVKSRERQRTIHAHVGPLNLDTYQASFNAADYFDLEPNTPYGGLCLISCICNLLMVLNYHI